MHIYILDRHYRMKFDRDPQGRDRMVVGFITTYANVVSSNSAQARCT